MKFNYKKIASILASAVMLSSTMGFAAAVTSYPAPYIQNGALNGAIVVGSPSAQTMDTASAADLTADLNSKITVSATTTEVSGGESYQLKKSSTAFQLGNGIKDVVSGTVTKDNLPVLLKDGTYSDSSNNEFDYTQKLALSNLSYTMFEDSDYKEDVPALGMRVASGSNVLNYTLDFTNYPTWAKLETTEVEILGKPYYVLDATTNTSITLLDAAEKTVIKEGEPKTVTVGSKTYTIQIESLSGTASSPSAKLSVNGVMTNKLSAGETQKLSDGSYVGVREINMRDVAGTVGSVEISVGNGKLKLTSGSEVELNDDSISGLTAYFTNSAASELQQIKLVWAVDSDEFAADGKSMSIPGFNSIKLSYGGMTTPTKEQIVVKSSGNYVMQLDNFPLKDSTETIPLLYGDSSGLFLGLGRGSDKKLNTGVNTTTVNFNGDSSDEYFVLTWSDGRDAESYLMAATGFQTENSVNKTTIRYRKDAGWADAKKDAITGETVTVGNAEMTVGVIDKNAKTVQLSVAGNNNFRTLYSKDGMKVYLPYLTANSTSTQGAINLTSSSTTGHNATAFDLKFSEEDKNENKGAGGNLTVRLGWTATPEVQVSSVTVSGAGSASSDIETGSSTEVYRNYIYSALATQYEFDKGGEQDFVTITYNDAETYGNFFLTSSSASIGGGSQIKVFTDSEQDAFKDMNLIVVGGSCVNTVALKLIDSTATLPLCGEAFTAKTTVPNNKYIIKTYTSPYNSAKVATLVAGYNAEDTKAAIAALKSGAVKTDVGVQSIGPALGA